MSDSVLYKVSGRVAVITLDNPPVNALGGAVRKGVMDGMEQAWSDDAVRAVVINSTGKLFCGGADITEFGKAMTDPLLPDLLNAIEGSPKLVIAALDGAALGGGFELALVCHYRFALPRAKVGLPEVNLGLLPGAGGTQRLPRVAGVEKALTMITRGAPIGAQEALACGAVDRIHEGDGDFTEGAIAYAETLIDEGVPLRNCRSMDVDAAAVPEDFFQTFRAKNAKRFAGFFAPERCILAVEAACTLPLDEGLKRERELFIQCMQSPESRAQRHMFFAERQASKVPGISKQTAVRNIQSVAVIGSGTMGGGIAMNFAGAGIPVKVLEVNREALDRGLGVVRKNYEISAKRGKISAEQVDELMALLQGTLNYDDLAEVDLVIEAVFEDMDLKKKIFTRLDQVCKPGCILASNTSTLDIDEIAAVTSRPGDVLGLHFFSPANVMRLLEIVRGAQTAPDVLATAIALCKTIRKVGVTVGVCFGFVGNRMVGPYLREAHRLLLEGASPEQVDRVIEEYGLKMGPFAMTDLSGIDVGYLIRQATKDQHAFDKSFGVIGDKLYELGRLGQKTGHGYYIYEGRDRKSDSELPGIIETLSGELGITRREISDTEVLERCIYPLIDEGARILEEGVAIRSSDIDVIYCYGYGFPVFKGGPMGYADEIGPDKVYKALQGYHNTAGDYGEWWLKPSDLLKQLAEEGGKFKDYQKP
ncbi:MAG: 3-hydroxyacyl-CoA dehydrogenase NAD-binding domain-containing protein [Acidobacteriota bacterium]|nr:3-hydroxyacyl-CoA dehydrogenase NAD-binding domain-containing protein [Acidobacteriota bacterium]